MGQCFITRRGGNGKKYTISGAETNTFSLGSLTNKAIGATLKTLSCKVAGKCTLTLTAFTNNKPINDTTNPVTFVLDEGASVNFTMKGYKPSDLSTLWYNYTICVTNTSGNLVFTLAAAGLRDSDGVNQTLPYSYTKDYYAV